MTAEDEYTELSSRAEVDIWRTILTAPEEPDVETCVAAAALLRPTYATVNIHEVRDAVFLWVKLDVWNDHLDRLLRMAHTIEANRPDAPGRADIEFLVAYVWLGDIRSAEAWAMHGDIVREHLNAALTIDPGHNMARVLLQMGNRLQHVSGGVA